MVTQFQQGTAATPGELHKDILEVEVSQVKGGVNRGQLFWRCHTASVTASLFSIQPLLSAGYISMDDVRYGRWGEVGRRIKLDHPIPATFILTRNHRIGKNFWEVLSIDEEKIMTVLTPEQKAQVVEFVKSELSRFDEAAECVQEDDHISFKLKSKETSSIFKAQEAIHVPMMLVGCELHKQDGEVYIKGKCKYPSAWSKEALGGHGYPSRTNDDGVLEIGYAPLGVGDVVSLNIPCIHLQEGKITKGEKGVVIELPSDDDGNPDTYMVTWGSTAIHASVTRSEVKHLPNAKPPEQLTDLIEADAHRQTHQSSPRTVEALIQQLRDELELVKAERTVAIREKEELNLRIRGAEAAQKKAEDELKVLKSRHEAVTTQLSRLSTDLETKPVTGKTAMEVVYAKDIQPHDLNEVVECGYEIVKLKVTDDCIVHCIYRKPKPFTTPKHDQLATFKTIYSGKPTPPAAAVEETPGNSAIKTVSGDLVPIEAKNKQMTYAEALEAFSRGKITIDQLNQASLDSAMTAAVEGYKERHASWT